MAIYAARGLCAAVYLAYTYKIYKYGINPLPSNCEKIISEGPVKDFVTTRAQAMSLKKELFVFSHHHYYYEGSDFFIGKASVGVGEKANINQAWTQFMITHEIANVKANDIVTWGWVTLVASIFITFLLNSISPVAACAAGLAAGLVTFSIVHSWREKVADITAMQYCSKEVNRAVLEQLKDQKKKEGQLAPPLMDRVFHYIAFPSLDEQIRYFEAYVEVREV